MKEPALGLKKKKPHSEGLTITEALKNRLLGIVKLNERVK